MVNNIISTLKSFYGPQFQRILNIRLSFGSCFFELSNNKKLLDEGAAVNDGCDLVWF